MNSLVERLCKLNLQAIYDDPAHHLSPNLRVELYKAFGPSFHVANFADSCSQIENVVDVRDKFLFADWVGSWLALLTAEKVLPVWQAARKEAKGKENEFLWGNPAKTIELAKKVLVGVNLPEKASTYLYCAFYNPAPWNNPTPSDLKFYLSCRAALDGLEFILLGITSLTHTGALLYTDAEKSLAPHDFASMAISAYAGFEENPSEKRLEFWEWWHKEAIPQAWELAEKSSKIF